MQLPPPCSASVLWKRTLRAITSGNLINVENALKIKGFNEKLFIDEVDHEFCYRGFKEELYTYKCIQGIFLIHKIGTPSEHSFLGRKVHPMNHSYIRKYYIVRNRLYVYKCFWDIAKYENFNCYIIGTLKLLVKMYLFEDDLWRKTKAIYAGVKDFILENYGKKKFRY